MKKLLLLLLISATAIGQTIPFSQLQKSATAGSLVISTGTGTNNVLTYTPTIPASKITGTAVVNTQSITINGIPQPYGPSTPSFTVGEVQSVSGSLVDNTDPLNPIIDLTTTVTDGYLPISSSGTFTESLISQSTNSVIIGTLPSDQANLIIRSASGGSNPYLKFERNGGTACGSIQGTAFGLTLNGAAMIYSVSTAHTFTGTSMTYNGNQVATTNQLPIITGSTGVTVSGTTPNYTISSASPTLTAGTNMSVTTSGLSYTIGVANAPTFTTTTLVGTTTQSLTNYNGALNLAKGVDIASSATTSIASATGNLIHITGTTGITNFGTGQSGTMRTCVFDNTLTITSSTSTILCPDNTSITTAAGDIMQVILDDSGIWRVLNYKTQSNVWQTWTPSYTGFSANPTSVISRYYVVGKMCTLYYACTGGTSSLTTTTITFPFTSANTGTQYWNIPLEQDNGSTVSGGGMGRIGANTNSASLFKGTLGAWTASGTKSFQFTCTYEIQ